MGKGGQKHYNDTTATSASSSVDDADDDTTKRNQKTKSLLLLKKRNKNLPAITTAQLASKCTLSGGVWLAYEGIVYDVTRWIPKHPGGIRAVMSSAGRDATAVMKSLHHPKTLTEHIMKRTRAVGRLVVDDDEKKNSNTTIDKDFEQLGQELLENGWYEPKLSAYFFPVLRAFALFGMGLKLVYSGDNLESTYDSLTLMAGSVLIGLFFQNVAFLGHDAGHGSITGRFDWDLYLGLVVGNGLTGIDLGWWKSTHYVHHSATNSLHDDPDIQHMPLLCFEERYAVADSSGEGSTTTDGLWSTYHGRYLPGLQHFLCRYIVPYQHYYFYPTLCVARFSLHIMSIVHVVQTCPLLPSTTSSSEEISSTSSDGKVKERYAWPQPSLPLWCLQAGSLVFYWTMLVLFLTSLDSWQAAALTLSCIYITTGILHVQIVLSHIPMQYCADGHGRTGGRRHGAAAASSDDVVVDSSSSSSPEISYYEWQALSTMDVDCPAWMDWFHGGLQFQLEHHLFPRVPRRNLRKLMKKTDALFQKHNIAVTRKPFLAANVKLLQHMQRVGRAVQNAAAAAQQQQEELFVSAEKTVKTE